MNILAASAIRRSRGARSDASERASARLFGGAPPPARFVYKSPRSPPGTRQQACTRDAPRSPPPAPLRISDEISDVPCIRAKTNPREPRPFEIYASCVCVRITAADTLPVCRRLNGGSSANREPPLPLRNHSPIEINHFAIDAMPSVWVVPLQFAVPAR
ncbi:unnamed protein product, partial [Iphiclides podalirius]